uniref:Uncharacterized protein n=1 Tax=Siphoviridae sp. ctDcW16 TaxID=2826199 RepID=A0A8S5MTS8_9CAUD|nr:MAG TPA: hypothetical protein [Siphoviridae sp. ctDcW16]
MKQDIPFSISSVIDGNSLIASSMLLPVISILEKLRIARQITLIVGGLIV